MRKDHSFEDIVWYLVLKQLVALGIEAFVEALTPLTSGGKRLRKACLPARMIRRADKAGPTDLRTCGRRERPSDWPGRPKKQQYNTTTALHGNNVG
ncbi:MAG: hypothetical protein AAF934_01145 [Bacteroidota bacterium]